MHICFLVIWFKNQIFSLFLIVKMNAKYAEICSVGNWRQTFNKFRLFIFSDIFIILFNINNSY